MLTEVFCLLEVMALWYSTSCGSLLLETLIIVPVLIYKFDTFIWNNIHLFVLIWNVVSAELYNVHYYVICMFLSAMRLVHGTENKLQRLGKRQKKKCLVFNWSLTLELTELKYCFLEVCLCRSSHAGSSQ